MARLKISAVYRDFKRELNTLLRLDKHNQSRSELNNKQLILLTECVFLAAFRAFENFLEESFLLYTLEKQGLSGRKPRSFLKPQNYNHSRDLVRSSMPFLDWANPETVIQRAETYLQNGGPIKTVLAGAKQDLLDMKILRNQIAHNSSESSRQYEKMLRRIYGTTPLCTPPPGRHLLNQKTSSMHYLHYYITRLLNVGSAISQ